MNERGLSPLCLDLRDKQLAQQGHQALAQLTSTVYKQGFFGPDDYISCSSLSHAELSQDERRPAQSDYPLLHCSQNQAKPTGFLQ